MITTFFWEKLLGIIFCGGGSFYPSNTLDRTLVKGRVFAKAEGHRQRQKRELCVTKGLVGGAKNFDLAKNSRTRQKGLTRQVT